MNDEGDAGTLTSRQSCAVFRIWWDDRRGQPARPVVDSLLSRPGLHRVGESLFAVTTVPGDPAVYDTAVAWSEALRAGGSNDLRSLIAPGVLRLGDDGRCELEADAVGRDLEDEAPELAAGIYLTSRAFRNLEYSVERDGDHLLATASGIEVPLVRAGAQRLDQPPWRNREVLGQPSPWIERLDAGPVQEAIEEPVLRLVGPLGSGKTRLLAETLRRLEIRHLWLTTRPERLGGPTLATQLVRQLLLPSPGQHVDPLHPPLDAETGHGSIRAALGEGPPGDRELRSLNEQAIAVLRNLDAGGSPVTLVIDDFHLATTYDLELADELAEVPVGRPVRLIFAGRGEPRWSARLASTPRIEIGPLGEGELRRLCDRVTAGYSLPDAVAGRFLESAAGCPFALEEGLFALVHEKNLRRVYGSFFFSGTEDRDFIPSWRYVRHVDAEVTRLTHPWPPRLLALLDAPAPPAELAAAVPAGEQAVDPSWHRPLARAGILASAASPWGEGVALASDAEARALAALLSENDRPRLRRRVGRQLASRSQTGEAHWHSYRLLEGSDHAAESLLALFTADDRAKIPPAELLEALASELAHQRGHSRNPPTELELLWRLLPLARKMGTLRNHGEELERAIELARSDPARLLALASLKAEMDQESGRYQEAEATIKQALEGATGVDPKRKALLVIQLGRLQIRRQRLSEARQLFTSVRQAVGASGSSPMAATCDFYLGNIALSEGELEEAHRHHLDALEQRRRQGVDRATGSSLSALGAVAVARGHYPQALDYYREAEEILEAHGKSGETGYSLLGQARALSRLGDYTGATRPVRRALALREGRDDTAGEALARLAVAKNYLDIGQPDVALEQARKAHFQLNLISAGEHLAGADSLLGRIHLSQRRYDAAGRRFEAARKVHQTEGDAQAAALDLAGLLEIALATGDAQTVRRHTTDLKNELPDLPSSDLNDRLSYRLYLGLEYLTATGLNVGNPLPYLERAYRGVLDKAEHLSHEQRQRYLFQIPHHQAILSAATDKGLAAAG